MRKMHFVSMHLCTAKAHVIAIWSWISLPNGCNYTRRQKFSIPPSKFSIFPQRVLPVCGLLITEWSNQAHLHGCHTWLLLPTAKLSDLNRWCWTLHRNWQVLFWQQTFSCSSCILRHTPQIHHCSASFSGSGDSDSGSFTPVSRSLAYSTLPRPWLSTLMRRLLSFSTFASFFTKSYRIKQRDFSYKQFVNKCQFFSVACDNLY